MQSNEEKLYQFMTQKLGSEAIARAEYLRCKLAELDVLEMTPTELYFAAEAQGGWFELLEDLTLADLDALLAPSSTTLEAIEKEMRDDDVEIPSPIRRKAKPRPIAPPAEMIPAPVEQPAPKYSTEETILDVIREHPWCSVGAIAQTLELPSVVVEEHLVKMLELGWLKLVGEAEDARYALA